MIAFDQTLFFSVGICFYGSYFCGAGGTIATLWREEETIVVSHVSVPKPTSGDKGEPSVMPPMLELRGSTFEVEVIVASH